MTTSGEQPTGTRTMKASEFKAKCLKLMDEVAESGEEIVITKNGQPVARLVSYRERPKTPFGRDRDRTTIIGGIISPMPAEWFADDASAEENLF